MQTCLSAVKDQVTTLPTMAPMLTQLSDARPSLRRKDWDKAAEAMAPRETDGAEEEDPDAWAMAAYGEADFSKQHDEDKANEQKAAEKRNLEGAEEEEPEGDDDAPPAVEGDGPPEMGGRLVTEVEVVSQN